MAVVAGRTNLQVRQSVGHNLGAVYVSTASSEVPDSSSLIDDTLVGPDDEFKGHWVRMVGGDLTGEQGRVGSYAESSTDLTVAPAFSGDINTADAYELWSDEYNPTNIDGFIKDAVLDLYGTVYVPDWDVSLFGDGKTLSFAIPTAIKYIKGLQWRSQVALTEIHNCNAAWDESVDGDATVTVDTVLAKRGNGSVKFVVAAGMSANTIVATDSFSSKNISNKTHLEAWMWSDVATTAGDWRILLDDTASCASPVESLSVPALTARTWTHLQLALANPELDTALISVGLKYVNDSGATQVRLDDMNVVNVNTARWTEIPNRSWEIDKEARQLNISVGIAADTAHKQIRIQGMKVPTLPTSDSSTFDVDDWYVICRTTELAFASHAQHGDSERRQTQADRWAARTNEAKKGFSRISGRSVE